MKNTPQGPKLYCDTPRQKKLHNNNIFLFKENAFLKTISPKIIVWVLTVFRKDRRNQRYKKIINHNFMPPPCSILTKTKTYQSDTIQGTNSIGVSHINEIDCIPSLLIPFLKNLFVPWGFTEEADGNRKTKKTNCLIKCPHDLLCQLKRVTLSAVKNLCVSISPNPTSWFFCFYQTSSSLIKYLFSFVYLFRIIRSRIAECVITYCRVLHCVLHVTQKKISMCVTHILTKHVNKVKAIP